MGSQIFTEIESPVLRPNVLKLVDDQLINRSVKARREVKDAYFHASQLPIEEVRPGESLLPYGSKFR